MHSITQELIKLDPTLQIHNEGEWSGGAEASKFTAFNSGGIECETGELLYSLIRLLKPTRVLETGTHYGVGASYMGMALKENGEGILDTIEFLPEIYRTACQRLERMGLLPRGSEYRWVNPLLMDVAQFVPEANYDLILLDTEPQTRFAEFGKFWDYLKLGGFVFIHDLHRHMHQIPNEEHGFAWPYGPITDFMSEKVNRNQARPFHFSTPRGLTGFYKVSPDDYKWINE